MNNTTRPDRTYGFHIDAATLTPREHAIWMAGVTHGREQESLAAVIDDIENVSNKAKNGIITNREAMEKIGDWVREYGF